MTSNYWSWKAIKDWFEFFLILAALCACGYIAWNQLIYLYLMLLLGGIAAGLAPLVSPLYSIPRDWIGLAPSLNNLFEISREKLGQIDYLEESELRNATAAFIQAKDILAYYAQKHPDLINQYSELREIYQVANEGQQRSQEIYEQRVRQRQIHEEKQQQERQHREQWLESKRREKGVRYGAPPDPHTNRCPPGYPIRATENLTGKNYRREKSRGIYYQPGEAKYDSIASWCFESWQQAEADNFRPSKRRKKG